MPHGRQLTEPADRTLRRWLLIRRILGITLVLGVFCAVWLLALAPDEGPGPILPDVDQQFSLDLEVIQTADEDTVYVVEQRAHPFYRIFAFDPATGDTTTVFTVPEDAIVYGIALNPERTSLAVAYSPDLRIGGSGLWTLDLDSGAFTMVADAEPDIYLTELEWAADGNSVFATHVDRREDEERLSVATVDIVDGDTTIVRSQAMTPMVNDGDLYYLEVDAEKARRSIGVMDGTGTASVIEILGGARDLDHLIAGADGDGSVRVAVLDEQDDGLLSIGSPASAHGNHNVPSAWWSVGAADDSAVSTELEPIIVYDASVTTSGSIVYATVEGLSIGADERLDLIKSRAIRFVAA
jgi:hypothetical protein